MGWRKSLRLLTYFPPFASLYGSTDVDMEEDHFSNGVTESSSNGFLNGSSKHGAEPEDCDADMGELAVPPNTEELRPWAKPALFSVKWCKQ